MGNFILSVSTSASCHHVPHWILNAYNLSIDQPEKYLQCQWTNRFLCKTIHRLVKTQSSEEIARGYEAIMSSESYVLFF